MTDFTPPETWVDDVLVTATMLNRRITKNMAWLKSRPFNQVVIPSTTTTSAPYVEMTGSSVSLTTEGGDIMMGFTGANSNSGFNISRWDLAIDGTRVDGGSNGFTNAVTVAGNQWDCICMVWQTSTPPSAGSHTYSVYWCVSGGTVTGYGRLYVIELR